jgi:hypothetical protein
MSNQEIVELAGNCFNHEIMNQITNNRFVYNLLHGEFNGYSKLSVEAKNVIDFASELLRHTMIFRSEYSDYENQGYNWDAGYAQLKGLWKYRLPDDFKEFRQLYKTLEDRMRPLVYELGFLMR